MFETSIVDPSLKLLGQLFASATQHASVAMCHWTNGRVRMSLDEVIEKFTTNAGRFAAPADTDIENLRRWTELDDLLPLLKSLGVET